MIITNHLFEEILILGHKIYIIAPCHAVILIKNILLNNGISLNVLNRIHIQPYEKNNNTQTFLPLLNKNRKLCFIDQSEENLKNFNQLNAETGDLIGKRSFRKEKQIALIRADADGIFLLKIRDHLIAENLFYLSWSSKEYINQRGLFLIHYKKKEFVICQRK